MWVGQGRARLRYRDTLQLNGRRRFDLLLLEVVEQRFRQLHVL
jgi:hypothetical protein